MTITTKLEPASTFMRIPCFCCGRREMPVHAVVWVCWDGEDFSHVCAGCVEAGPEAAAKRMQDQASDLRDQAANLDEAAANGIPLPSLDEYRKAVREATIEWLMDAKGVDRAAAEQEIEKDYPFEASPSL